MSIDYSKLSDFEINGLIAKRTQKVGDFTQARGFTFIHEYGNPVADFGALCLGWKEFDPCNNPADAWPIIVGNKVSIVSLDNKWLAAPTETVIDGITGDSDVCFYASSDAVFDANPLRAAMIVFLMMQESKNAS